MNSHLEFSLKIVQNCMKIRVKDFISISEIKRWYQRQWDIGTMVDCCWVFYWDIPETKPQTTARWSSEEKTERLQILKNYYVNNKICSAFLLYVGFFFFKITLEKHFYKLKLLYRSTEIFIKFCFNFVLKCEVMKTFWMYFFLSLYS